jgi:hypothetical protein
MRRIMWAGLLGWAIGGALAPVSLPRVVWAESPPEAWQRLSPEQRARARRNYERFQQLPEKDRERIEQRYRRWQRLEPEQRERMRENYESYRGLDPAERERFEKGYEEWIERRGGGAER